MRLDKDTARGVLAVAMASLVASCATMISGSTQNIEVTSAPPGARVTVQPGAIQGLTPVKLTLRRKDAPYRVTIEMDGYQPYEASITTETNGWTFGNILIGGLVGLIVDSSTGAQYRLTPERVHGQLAAAGISLEGGRGNVLALFTPDGAPLVVLELAD